MSYYNIGILCKICNQKIAEYPSEFASTKLVTDDLKRAYKTHTLEYHSSYRTIELATLEDLWTNIDIIRRGDV